VANKCLICGKYVKGFNACHSKCLNKSDVSLEKILKKGGWAAKPKLPEYHFYGCKCGNFKSSTKMLGKCPKCGAKFNKYGKYPK
jgi:hypothetical protein